MCADFSVCSFNGLFSFAVAACPSNWLTSLLCTQVKEFVKSYNILHEMGFTSPNVPVLLAIHDNDPDKVIQRLLSSPSWLEPHTTQTPHELVYVYHIHVQPCPTLATIILCKPHVCAVTCLLLQSTCWLPLAFWTEWHGLYVVPLNLFGVFISFFFHYLSRFWIVFSA